MPRKNTGEIKVKGEVNSMRIELVLYGEDSTIDTNVWHDIIETDIALKAYNQTVGYLAGALTNLETETK